MEHAERAARGQVKLCRSIGKTTARFSFGVLGVARIGRVPSGARYTLSKEPEERGSNWKQSPTTNESQHLGWKTASPFAPRWYKMLAVLPSQRVFIRPRCGGMF